MSFLQGVAMGMVKRANAVSRQRAIDNRDRKIRDEENRNQIGLSLANGVIAGDVRPETYNLFIDDPNSKFEDIVPNLAADRKYYNEIVKQKEHKEAGFKYLQTLVDAGIVPAEELGNATNEDWGIDKYYDTATKYVTIDDSTKAYEANVKAKTEMFANKDIREAYQGPDPAIVIADMEFTPANILSMSMAMSEEAENPMKIGNLSFPTSDDYYKNINDANELVSGRAHLVEISNLIRDPKTRKMIADEFKANPQALAVFDEDLQRFADYYIGGQIKNATNSVTGEVSGYVPPATDFKGLFDFLKEVKPDSTYLSREYSETKIKNAAKQAGEIEVVANSLVFNYIDSNQEEQTGFIEFDEGQIASITRMATNLNYSSPQDFINNFKFIKRADTPEEAYSSLVSAIRYEALNVNAFNTPGGADERVRFNVGKALIEEFRGNKLEMAQSIVPLMTVSYDKKGKKRAVTTMKPIAVYLKQYLDVDVAKVKEQYGATEETIRLLRELQTLVLDEDTPSGFVGKLKGVFGGIFAETGQLDQLLGDNTDNVTSQQVLTKAKSMGFVSTDVLTNLSEKESLKLTLAAKMARAIDPSGRLSNQDFEVQLARLGQSQLFSAKTQSKAALDVVINDFIERRGKLQGIYDLATETAEFNPAAERLLKAHSVIDKSISQFRLASYTGQEQAKKESSVGAVGALTAIPTPDGGNIYQDEKGTFFEDDQGKTSIPDANVLDRLSPKGQSI